MSVFTFILRWINRNKKTLIYGYAIKTVLVFSVMGFTQNSAKNTAEISVKTSAVCGMCKERIEKGLAFEKGVKEASLDLKTKMVTVTYKVRKTDPDKIRKAISRLGYDADDVPADEKAYGKLPACCKKDAAPH
ncbi:MAG TPA: heavy metal-associated domain-containing protein [Bacteroidales bacterium]|nr:heavy metal-associated domain-containing protein [Bacteroidales bacterium]HSA43899.1 heavy metal-associated domain-containing protein [Bacteroidales bacterium]